jgi:leader peptidase (prepilin peptidase)/N-methyltransferase
VGLLLILAGVLGLSVGSFLNVVIWRVPRGESIVRPPSACPRCGHRIEPRDNVPVVSWIVLRARCRHCGEPISARYPAVEATTAALFVVTTGVIGPAWVLPAMLYLVGVGVALALIDLEHHRLPDALVLPSYTVAAVLLAVASWNPGGVPDWGSLGRAVAGGAALAFVYLVLVLIHPGGMGLGDVKLAGLTGLYLGWFGWGSLVVGGFGAFLLGGAYSLVLVVLRRAGRRSGIPFGPWILLATLLGCLVGEQVWNAYLGLF